MVICVVVKVNGFDFQEVEIDFVQFIEEFIKVNFFKKVFVFVGVDGFIFIECIVIVIYGMWYLGFDGDIVLFFIFSFFW